MGGYSLGIVPFFSRPESISLVVLTGTNTISVLSDLFRSGEKCSSGFC